MVDDFDEFGVSSEDKLARGDGGDISREMVGDDVDAEGAAPPPEGEGGEPVVVVDADSDIPGTVEEFTPPRERVVVEVPVDMIVPSPYQRRRTFDVGRLEEMAASIRAHGVLQPIVVRRPSSPDGEGAADGPAPTRYELIAGERRWRAARMAGLATIPALLVHCTELEAARLCAIENLQREDLNAIEEAETYRVMVDLGMTQGELGEQIGKSQSAIANSLRLLRLPAPVQTLLVDGPLTASHGKALAREAGFPPVCQRIAEIAVAKGASTKELELTGPCKLPYAHQLADEGIVLQFAYGAGGFPWKDTCPDCPFGAFRAGYH
ncbi:MAG TPA: ParB/RepB/Spo0J family partition protein, partial [Armatimonadota bacterium]|nr:ParB/RepB/Spo0J family partition protein [Armatimonadota bacterium]